MVGILHLKGVGACKACRRDLSGWNPWTRRAFCEMERCPVWWDQGEPFTPTRKQFGGMFYG